MPRRVARLHRNQGPARRACPFCHCVLPVLRERRSPVPADGDRDRPPRTRAQPEQGQGRQMRQPAAHPVQHGRAGPVRRSNLELLQHQHATFRILRCIRKCGRPLSQTVFVPQMDRSEVNGTPGATKGKNVRNGARLRPNWLRHCPECARNCPDGARRLFPFSGGQARTQGGIVRSGAAAAARRPHGARRCFPGGTEAPARTPAGAVKMRRNCGPAVNRKPLTNVAIRGRSCARRHQSG
jgi:hypothetical protein